jgi:DNA-binding protein Fis
MITLVISEDEAKAKETIINMLKGQGYTLSDILEQDGVIRIVKKNCIRDLAFIRDRVIEIGEALFEEKKGALYKSVLEAIEKPLIERILGHTEGNQLKAARILGINRNTMRAKVKKLGIDVNKWKIR